MFYAVDFKQGKIGVMDSDDNNISYYSPSKLKQIIKDLGIEIFGVTIDENINPMFTLDGLIVNLKYIRSNVIYRFLFALLLPGDRWGSKFETIIEKPTVAIFDKGVEWSIVKYPCGQYICSYYADTLLAHDGGLVFDASVEAWRIDALGVKQLKIWLKYQLEKVGINV